MKGDPKVIEFLNDGLRHELTSINQYWLHYRLLANWGLEKLAKKWRQESIEEMQHADRLMERMIFLDGIPNMQTLARLHIGRTVKEVDLPRFRGEVRAWDHGSSWAVILSSGFMAFLGSAPGGAILPSRPARWCGRRAQRRSRTAASCGRPEGLSLTVASTTAGWSASGSTAGA